MEKDKEKSEENSMEGRILDRLSSSKKAIVSSYFDPAEVEGALKELQESGTVFGSLTSQEFVQMLRDKGVMEKRRLSWL